VSHPDLWSQCRRAVAITAVLTGGALEGQERPRANSDAFVIEGTAAIAASAVSLGAAVMSIDKCGDDLGCGIGVIGLGLVGAAVLAPVADVVVGHAFNTKPSAIGAAVGSIVGSAAAIGLVYLITEAGGFQNEPEVIVAYAVPHGVFTALGSRLFAQK
jgi:hypothetical protein